MARGGLYRTDVERARRTLLAQGKHPSIDAVRVELGNTGSKSTIHRYLKELEAEDGPAGATVAISEALQDLVGRLAAQLHAEAEAVIAQAKGRFDTQLTERTEALAQQMREAAALSTQLQRTETELVSERQLHARSLQTLQERQLALSRHEERNAGLATRIGDLESHVASLETKHQQARDALEHFRVAAKEQRDQENRRHEHQVQSLQLELRQALEALASKNHELQQLNGEASRLTEKLSHLQKEVQHAANVNRQQHDEIEALGLARAELQSLKMRWAQDLQALEDLRSELAGSRSELAREREARSLAETTAAAAQSRLATLDAIFAKWEVPQRSVEPVSPSK